MVLLEELDTEDERYVLELVERHRAVTGSLVAARLIEHWSTASARLVRVMPTEYKKALEAQRAELQGVAV
jgi:glutamate synthase (NADPH/NADH) large chain